MQREWALDLDMMSIRVMARTTGQWQPVAVQSLEEADFADQFAALVAAHDVGPNVLVFLPASQVLYRSVEISSLDQASAEIERVLDQDTPYSVDELEFDWELEAKTSARVAAVAQETLEEASAFVESFGLSVTGYSALAGSENFPRRPDFGGGIAVTLMDLVDETDEFVLKEPQPDEAPHEPEHEAPQEPAFSTSRPPPPLTLDAANPVVDVPMATPVAVAGAHIDDVEPTVTQPDAPRVATDLPMAGETETSGLVAARVLSRGLEGAELSRPLRLPAEVPNRVMMGVAAALTIGVGAIIWTIMPGDTATPEPTDSVGLSTPATDTGSDPEALTAAVEPVPTDAEPEARLDLSDTAPVIAFLETTGTQAPEIPSSTASIAPLYMDGSNLHGDVVALETPRPGPTAIVASKSAPHPEASDVASILAAFTLETDTSGPWATQDTQPLLQLATLGGFDDVSGLLPELEAAGVLAPPLPPRPANLAGIDVQPALFSNLPDLGSLSGAVELAALDPDTRIGEFVALPSEVPADQAPSLFPDAPAALVPPVAALTEETPAPAEVDVAPLEVTPQVVEDTATEPGAPVLPTPTEFAQGLPDTRPSSRPEEIEIAAANRAAEALLPQPTELAANLPDRRPSRRPTLPEPAEPEVVAEAEDTPIAEDTIDAIAEDVAADVAQDFATALPVPDTRPRARPAAAQQAAEARATALASATNLAVALVALPKARPSGLAERARQAAAAAVRAPDTSSAVNAALAAVEPPRVSVQPSQPSNVTAARRATVEDAIRLNKINLIGVFGLPNDRRALVRLPSGRFVRVKVGDRVDGGNVSSITDSRLRYVKGGNTITLELPSG